MKIKKGFVSNSSSSSFVIKTEMSKEELDKELRRIFSAYNELVKKDENFEDVFSEVIDVIDGEHVNEEESYFIEGYEEKRFLQHNFILRSEGDNTVPYLLSQILEACFTETIANLGFSCYRIHRG